jgi:predicted ATPase with chaperone activity
MVALRLTVVIAGRRDSQPHTHRRPFADAHWSTTTVSLAGQYRV